MEEKPEEVEDVEGESSDSFITGSKSDTEDEEFSEGGQENDFCVEEILTDQDVQELVAEFFEVESKAAEAQESLEKESLAKVECEVREELSYTLQGDDLEDAVKNEMKTFTEEWEATLDELETESAKLLEQLDGAGVELPKLFKVIECQAPNGCRTDAWKRRAHWVGSQMTSDISKSVADAEKYLHAHRPVKRKHGKMLEEGASGFLQKKFAANGAEEAAKGDLDWASLKNLFSSSTSEDVASFGSKDWALVYMANTPQEAAELGLQFPGVNEVEEIENIDSNSSDPFVADAIANEMDLPLSEEQRKNYRKVKEEDDIKFDKKFQLRLKKRRCLKMQEQLSSVNRWSTGRNQVDHNDDEGKKSENENILDLNDNCLSKLSSIKSNENYEEASERWGDLNNLKTQSMLIEGDDEDCNLKDNHNAVDVGECSTIRKVDEDGNDETYNGSTLQKFHCTACDRDATVKCSHPLLLIIVCKDCRDLLEVKILRKDRDCFECYCGWCGKGGDFVTCKSCNTLFCTRCIRRNLGEECLSKAQAFGWKCCCCCPEMLDGLIDPQRNDRCSAESSAISSESDAEAAHSEFGSVLKRKPKKKIRRILDDTELGEETKRKIALEKERQDRLNSLKVQSSENSSITASELYFGGISDVNSVDMLDGVTTGYIVNVARENGEAIVRIPCSISANLKAHQVTGIRFLWENIIQSISKVKLGDKGLGCILAHTMGLGKTFQVIAFLYVALRSVDLGLRTALIVTPVNVLHNWKKEFIKWKPSESEIKPIRIFMLEDAPRERRAELLQKWRKKGGVFLIGYAAFRNLSFGKNVKDRNIVREICSALQDGPDILVCDEAHIIKNTRAETTQALKLVKCQRRIALTGSPLQNNLMEYYCMVDFVREGFLGSSHEFRNRFQNPIENGQHTNSTAEDVKIMNQRSHILYEQLKGFVQRMDMSVVKKDLPQKTVFVVGVKLSPLQRKLYKRFLDVHGFTKNGASEVRMRKCFFAGYQALAQIWNHPGIFQLREDKDLVNPEDMSDGSSDENLDNNTIGGDNSKKGRKFTQNNGVDDFVVKGWWSDLLHQNNFKEVEYSGKMVLLLDILTMASVIGDKTLVFSQSIFTLDLIELFLSRLNRHEKLGKFWKKGKDWYRLDGRTESSERQRMVEKFNDPDNKRVKCTLISTRAGSLGINLHAANRVVIVDGSWNPTYDLQAIYRAWRYGQVKPVFAYRLLAHGTMEEKIYKRQVTKEGLAARVVDRQQIHRMISREEMLHLFDFGDEDYPENMSVNHNAGNSTTKDPTPGSCSSDKLMESLLAKHCSRWIANYHEHETFFQENEEERLTKEEQDMAWEVYRRSLEWDDVQRGSHDDPSHNRKTRASDLTSLAPAQRPAALYVYDEDAAVHSKSILRRLDVQRRCTNLAHLLTLRSHGVKIGNYTVCGECAQEIRWDDLKKT